MATLPPHARTALDALCRRIIPVAFEDASIDIVALVEQRVGTLDAGLQRELRGALHFFDHPVTGMLLSGRPRRFSTLPPAEQDAMLSEWERSSLALRRTVFQALRRIILSTYYSQPSSHAGIGFLGPLHLRAREFAWEGAAPDSAAPDGPFARSTTPDSVPAMPPERDWTPDVLARVTRGSVVPRDSVMRADVCVIGSGAGGAVAAARLAEEGFDVVVIEEGGLYTASDFDDDEARLTPLLYADAAARATDDLSIILLQGRAVGGSTTVNWMMTLRPQPWVLHEWENDLRQELLSERVLGPALDDIERAIHARPVPDDAHTPSNRVILDGCAELGWDTLPAQVNVDGCVRAGSCSLGCRWN
ncbi:MAG TPA: GMC family oxidoreductase N-terminal domain-containing protein, partial [Longimicrobiales bacterium]|nr:GMC family oxidoreductase N-terminal domain-containing protein [Longimicrobiales bacterium]